MMSATFDTHFFIKKLTSNVMPEKQAEAVIDIVRETRELDLNTVATKADIKDIKADLRELELRLQNQIKDLQIRLGSMIVALGGILVAIKYFG